MREVKVVDYCDDWPKLFLEEEQRIRAAFKNEITNIHHIGSTSVPGLMAKPVIDILVEVGTIDVVDSYNEVMKQMGYLPKGENGIPNRQYFSKGGDNRTHHVHVYQQGDEKIAPHLMFRDYLIAHPMVTSEDEALKLDLAKKYQWNADSYTNGKESFVQSVLEKIINETSTH